MAQHIQWGTIQFIFDNDPFRKGFFDARRWYFEDVYGENGRAPEEPQRARSISSEELIRLVIMPDAQGVYHFDEMGDEHLPEYLGYLFGYMSGPFLPETLEEAHERMCSRRVLQEV